VDEYEVRGSIRVSPYTPPPPDPCQAERAACNRAAEAVERLDEAIARLKTQYAQAPASQKPGIREEIQEAEAERAQALAEAQRAQEAYDECRARNPIRSKAFTF